jgi:hypothetical protein
MHENNFEEQVREKMDQLGFDPAEAVWAGVDREINKDRKRRRPLFWLFFLSGLLLAGGGYYFISGKNNSIPVAMDRLQNHPDDKQEMQPVYQDHISKNEKSKEDKVPPNIFAGNAKTRGLPHPLLTGKTGDNNLRGPAGDRFGKITKSGFSETGLKDSIPLNAGGDEVNTGSGADTERQSDTSMGRKMNSLAAGRITLADSADGGRKAGENKQQKKSSYWKAGFTGSAGISSISQSLFHSAYTAYPAYLVNAPTGSPAGPGVLYKSSDLNPGFAFSAGVFVCRNLSKRISFSAGINYRYYSTKINTGNRVDSSVSVYTASVQASAVNSFYRNGKDQTYTNQYHFIELPLDVHFQLNRSSKTPVIWEAGFSLAYLVSSNALHFDPYSNVYYENNHLFNKTQLNTATAILIGLRLDHAELQMGPQVQYGLTGLENNSSAGPQHLFYYGMKISLIPGKK